MTPEDLRKEANAAAFLAQLVSYGRDKDWLAAKAVALRAAADRLEADLVPRAEAPAAGSPRRRKTG